MNGKFRLGLLAFLTVFVLSLSIGPIRPVSALSPVSTLYLTPNATGPLTLGSNFDVNITGDHLGSSSTSGINGWDIVITDNDPAAANLNPVSISIAGNLLSPFGTISEVINCVNAGAGLALNTPGNLGCDIRDGVGVVHSAAVIQGFVSPPISGLIAKISYTVNGAGEDLLNVPSPCPSAQGCDTLTDGTPIPVPHITRGADIQTPNNDFVLTTTNPAATNPGSSVSGTVNIASLNTYSAAIAFTTDTFPGTGLTPACSAISPSPVAPGGTASATCTFNSIIPGIYVVTVNATDGTLFHLAPFIVKVGDFALGTPLAAVGLVTTNTGSAAISVSSINGFSGTVAVSSTVSPVTGLTVICSPSLTATPTIPGSGSCALSSSTPGTYSVRVNGTYAFTGGKITHINSFNVNVQDFAITTTSTQPVVMASGATSAAAQVRLAALFGWNRQVVFTITTDVPGLTANCGAAVVPTAAGVLRACTLTSTTPGAYTLTVTATCGTAQGCAVSVAHSTTVTARVQDISIQYTGVAQPITLVSGGTNSTTFTVSSLPANSAGFAGTTNIATMINPLTGLSATCPTNVILTAGATSPQQTCTFNSSTPNTYTVTLNATALITTGQTVKHTITITVIVKPAAVSHPTTTVMSCHPSTIVVNNSTSCLITVTDTSGTPTTPTGTVSFTTSATGTFTTCTLAGTGAAVTCTITYTPTVIGTGSHTLTAIYSGDSSHLGTQGTAVIAVTVRTTTTSISCHPLTIVVNNSTSCTVTVTDTSPGTAITPSGTVSLTSSGTGTFTACTLGGTGASVTCSSTYTPTVIGTGSHLLTANYGGDSTHSTSQGTTTITVTQRSTTTTVSCTPSPDTVNSAATCTATVQDISPGTVITPSGTVAFSSNATAGSFTFVGSSCTLGGTGATAACQVTYTPTGSAPRHDLITVTYSGDLTHSGSQGAFLLQVSAVAAHQTTTTISCRPKTIVVNNVTSCIVTVTDTSPGTTSTPSGTVTLTSSGTGTFSACTLGGSGAVATCSVTYTPTVVGTGSHLLTANYNGDATHSTSSGTATITVTVRATSTTISCHPTTIVVNNVTTCVVTVTDISPGTAITPGGSVTFTSSGTGTFTACTLSGSGAVATCSVTYTPTAIGTGSHLLTANYGGDTNHNTSSGTATITVTQRSTTTTVSCTPSPDTVNSPATCTATVRDISPGTAITPSGTVAFSTNATAGSFTFTGLPCTLGGTGATAACQVTYTPTGAAPRHDLITGTYSGDTTHKTSQGTFLLAVTGQAAHATTTTISCHPTTIVVNNVTSCLVTVTDTSLGTAITPGGSVTFTSSGTGTFTACTLGGIGVSATCTVTYTPTVVGTSSHLLTANYAGDTNHNASLGTATVTVTVRSTRTTISCAPSTLPIGQASVCTATVVDTSPGAISTPGGTITFSSLGGSGSFSVTTCTLSAGTCSVTFTPNTTTASSISASYGGDANHSGSATATSATVTGVQTTFTISAASPASVPVGASATSTITITGLSGFVGTVSLSDSPLPAGLTCQAFNPTSVTLPPSPATALLSCSSPTPAAYTVTITAASGILTQTTTATFTFSSPSQGDFTLSMSPTSITLAENSPEIAIVTLHSNGFNGMVDLSVKISPTGQGLTVHLVRIHVPLGPTSTQKIVLLVSGDEANAGDYTVTVTGMSGSLSHSASLKVTVTQGGDDDTGSFGQFFSWLLLQVSTSRWD